jgi:hypothetical protein
MERVETGQASLDDLLELGGTRSMARKAFLWMSFVGDTIAFKAGQDLLGIAFFVPDRAGDIELCMTFRPKARVFMLPIIHVAHLTLDAIAETGATVFCHVMAGNRSGERLAKMTGFAPILETRWERQPHVRTYEGDLRRQLGSQGGAGSQADTGRGQ